MVAVFVHGVPETPAIWHPLVAELGVDGAVLLQLPGFGRPLPDGFEPTMGRLADWMADELEAIDGPIDLVVHDWGAILAWRALAARPGLVRSLVTDGPNLDEHFEWHDMAKLWQTPGDGEAFMETFVSVSDGDRGAMLAGSGVPEHAATAMAAAIDTTMAETILVLYRSATDIGNEWGPAIDSIDVPTLVVDSATDPYRSEGSVAQVVERLGAGHHVLPDQGHWWMLGDPVGGARAIADFWASLPSR